MRREQEHPLCNLLWICMLKILSDNLAGTPARLSTGSQDDTRKTCPNGMMARNCSITCSGALRTPECGAHFVQRPCPQARSAPSQQCGFSRQPSTRARLARPSVADPPPFDLKTTMSNPIKEGKCHLCGRIGQLTFEHVPPHSAFNDHPVLLLKFDEALTVESERAPRGKKAQRGSGAYTLGPYVS